MATPETLNEMRTEQSPASRNAPTLPAQEVPSDQPAIRPNYRKLAKTIAIFLLRALFNICIRWPLLFVRATFTSREEKMLRELKTMRKMMADEQRQKCSKQRD